MKAVTFWIIVLLLVTLCSCEDILNNHSSTGGVSGTVVCDTSNAPLEGVVVTFSDISTSYTNESGHYSFTDIEAGTYGVTVSLAGYESVQASVSIEPEKNKILDFSLHMAPYAR